jgi:hypothetical protein
VKRHAHIQFGSEACCFLHGSVGGKEVLKF